jgi:DNA-directed RNA polymerase specialized sigma24 family protein/TolA-binding protein
MVVSDPLLELARAANGGDSDAMCRLLAAVSPAVQRVARTIMGVCDAEALDATQESLLAFASALDQFRGESGVLHFACRIALHVSVSARRRVASADTALVAFRGEATGSAGGPRASDDELAARQRRDTVRALLDSLPEAQAAGQDGVAAAHGEGSGHDGPSEGCGMRRVDLHPEELLDAEREAREPTAHDRARLDEHLAACEACTFERAAVKDFAAALGREEAGDRAAADQALAGAIERLHLRARPGRGVEGRATAGRMSRGLLVAAVIAAASVAGAAGTWFAVALIRSSESAEPPAPAAKPAGPATAPAAPAAVPPAPTSPEPRGRSPRHARAPLPPDVSAPPPVVPGLPPVVAPDPPPAVPANPAAMHPPRRPPSPPEPAVSLGDTAPTLFTRANAARRVGDFEAAVEAYEELARRYPGSREEVLSRATFGTLALNVLGAPQRALGLFDAYLATAPDGTLAEEALVGRAEALDDLGRDAEERAAWEELLARFPDSSHGDRARARLEVLR